MNIAPSQNCYKTDLFQTFFLYVTHALPRLDEKLINPFPFLQIAQDDDKKYAGLQVHPPINSQVQSDDYLNLLMKLLIHLNLSELLWNLCFRLNKKTVRKVIITIPLLFTICLVSENK